MKTLKVLTLSILLVLGTGLLYSLTVAAMPDVRHWVSAITMGLKTSPPAYIKNVVVYKEGDGLVIYLTMADARGALTRAEGMLTVSIQQDRLPIWTHTYSVRRSDFRATTVGLGAFERPTLLYSLGRISERALSRAERGRSLTIEVLFITMNMVELKGTQTYWF
jgi:hypothetical protein